MDELVDDESTEDMAARAELHDFLARVEGVCLMITDDDIVHAFRVLGIKSRLTKDGTCVNSWR